MKNSSVVPMGNNRDICFVMRHFFFENKGGAELQVFYLARELAFRGWQVNYIREKGKIDFSEKKFEGIKLHTIYIPKTLAHPKLLFIKQIFRRIQLSFYQKRLKPTVIYVRADESYLPLFGRSLNKNKFKLEIFVIKLLLPRPINS